MQNINKINIKQSEKINKIIMHNSKIINKNKKNNNNNNIFARIRNYYKYNIRKKQDDTEDIDEIICSICFTEDLRYIRQTKCEHYFCKKCLHDILKYDYKCPICRTNLKQKNKIKN